MAGGFDYYAGLADTFPFEEQAQPTMGGEFGLLVREPVGVVGAIIPWNAPIEPHLLQDRPRPAGRLHGRPEVLARGARARPTSSPRSPRTIGLPPGVLNVVTADREVSELLVRNPGVDKITFTGSTAAGRRIASICGERIARCTLELGGKSAAVILDDMDLEAAAGTARRRRVLPHRPGVLVADPASSSPAAATTSSSRPWPARSRRSRVGDPFDAATQMGPLASSRQRDRVEGYIAKGVDEGATLVDRRRAPDGPRPRLLRGADRLRQRRQPLDDRPGGDLRARAQRDPGRQTRTTPSRIANDTIYGLNASVFTNDVDRARQVAGQLRSGTVGHNAFRTDFGMAFGGFKQSGIGREGGIEGLLPFLETKTVILNGEPTKKS